MSYCTYCGRELKEGETCDCRQNTQVPYQQPPIMKGNKKKFNKKTGIIAGSCGAVLVILIIVIVFLFTRGSYKKPMENLVSLANKKETSVEKYIDVIAPKFISGAFSKYSHIAKNTDLEESIEEIEDEIKDSLDDFEYNFGYDWKISYKIKDQKKLNARDLASLENEYEEYYYDELKDVESEIKDRDEDAIEDIADRNDISESDLKQVYIIFIDMVKGFKTIDISEGYLLKLDLQIKGEDDRDIKRDVVIPVIKVDGKWTLDIMTVMDMMDFDIIDLFQ